MQVHTTKALQALNIAQEKCPTFVLTQEIVTRHLKLTLLNKRYYFGNIQIIMNRAMVALTK